MAYIGRVTEDNRTDYWLLDQLGSISRNGQPSVEQICRTFEERATHTFSRVRPRKPLEVVLAGYDQNNRSFRATISNMRVNHQGFVEVVRDRFISDVRWFYPWSPKPKMYLTGTVRAFQAHDPTARALKNGLDRTLQHLKVNRAKVSEEGMALALVWLVRAASTHQTYGSLIGRDCLSVVAFPKEPRRRSFYEHDVGFPKKPNKTALFTGFYHPLHAASLHHQPHLADWYMDQTNLETDTDPEDVKPPPPNDPVGTNLALRTRIRFHNLPEGPNEDEG